MSSSLVWSVGMEQQQEQEEEKQEEERLEKDLFVQHKGNTVDDSFHPPPQTRLHNNQRSLLARSFRFVHRRLFGTTYA